MSLETQTASAAYGDVPPFEKPVSRLVLGSIAIQPDKPDDAFELIDSYVALGGNAIDTAHIYGPGRHEVVGQYLAARGRDTLIVMDKGCHPYGRNRVTREDMFADVDESLTRMKIDYVDFFVLHRDDPTVPATEVVEWLNELRQVGKIRAFGGSNWCHARLESANEHAKAHGLQPFSLSSPNLALALPQAEMWSGVYWLDKSDREWFKKSRFPIFSWSSGAGGFFAGVESDDVRRVYFNEDNFGRKRRAEEIGEKYGLSATQIAVAWTLNQPCNVFAITGPKNAAEVAENMKVAAQTLSPDELDYLELGR